MSVNFQFYLQISFGEKYFIFRDFWNWRYGLKPCFKFLYLLTFVSKFPLLCLDILFFCTPSFFNHDGGKKWPFIWPHQLVSLTFCMWRIIMYSSSFLFPILIHVISGGRKGFHEKSVFLYLRLNLSLERYGTDYFRVLRLPPRCHLMFGSCCCLISVLEQVCL